MVPPQPRSLLTSWTSTHETGEFVSDSDEPPEFVPQPANTKHKTWADMGFRFIDVREAHLRFLGWAFAAEPPPIERVVGRTMVDREYRPIGFCLADFEPSGVVAIHAHFGQWLRVYPTNILRGMKVTIDALRRAGVKDVYAIADRGIDGSDTLIKWFGGEPTGQVVELGPVYRIELARSRV